MLGQAASFAFLATISPTALLVLVVYLGSEQPRRTAMLYLAGAVIMSTVMAVVLLIVVRSLGLDLPTHRTPRYGLRLGIGMLALVAAAVMALRYRPAVGAGGPAVEGDQDRKPNGLMSRLVNNPAPLTAFLAGVLLFAPSLTFIAAVQVVATARASIAVTAIGLVTVVIVSAAIVWLPLLGYLFRPEPTTRTLKLLTAWLTTHGRLIGMTALAVAGVVLVLDGALGLT
jgi:hypothetical protein